MANTKIEWAEKVWNPVTGCTPISEGCANCYAKRMSRRLAGRAGYPPAPHNFDVITHSDKLHEPYGWKKPSRVFVCSMGDLFHENVSENILGYIFGVMERCPRHTFIVLTKRPERMRDFILGKNHRQWCLSNMWVGVTIENQARADERIPVLLEIPASVRFLSAEPLLGFVSFSDCESPENIGWVICGAETGPRKRPMDLAWARYLRDQCAHHRVPFFFKKDSAGNHTLNGNTYEEYPTCS